MKPKFHITATIGSYIDKGSGKKVKKFANCGTVFESPNGRLFMRLDTVPVTPEWSGFFTLRSASHEAAPIEAIPESETEDDTPTS